jgi:hypothetical protein
MALRITPERLAAVYDMLRAWPPFHAWRMPPSSEVKFRVSKTRQWYAAWWIEGVRHHIEVSEKKHGHLASVVASMAHEMLHVYQRIARTETRGVEHNAEFIRLAKRVCAIHGFDPGQFLG